MSAAKAWAEETLLDKAMEEPRETGHIAKQSSFLLSTGLLISAAVRHTRYLYLFPLLANAVECTPVPQRTLCHRLRQPHGG